MTIIDTTIYANGALRLSRHGAGKGGDVLVLEHDGRTSQFDVKPGLTREMLAHLVGRLNGGQGPWVVFDALEDRYGA